MAVPTKITVPEAPIRTQPSQFQDSVDVFLDFLVELRDYIVDVGDATHESGEDAEDARNAASLSDIVLTRLAGQIISINEDGDDLGVFLYSPEALGFASEDGALAGEINDRGMSPIRTHDAIGGFVPDVVGWEKIVVRDVDGDASIVFDNDDFDSDKYGDYQVVIRNLRAQTERAIRLRSSSDSGVSDNQVRYVGDLNFSGATNVPISENLVVGRSTDETGLSGIMTVNNLHGDHGAPFTFHGVVVNSAGSVQAVRLHGQLQKPTADGPVNHISIEATNGNLDSGEIVLYGLTDPSEIPDPGFRTTSRSTSVSGSGSTSRSTSRTTSESGTTSYSTSYSSSYQTITDVGDLFDDTDYRTTSISTSRTTSESYSTSYSTSYTTYYTSRYSYSRTTTFVTFDD